MEVSSAPPLQMALCGPPLSGKSSLLLRLIDPSPPPPPPPRPSPALFWAATLHPSENLSVPLSLCEVSSAATFRPLIQIWCHSADAVLVLYDTTSAQSFQEAQEMIQNTLLEGRSPAQILMLVGTKTDLENRTVPVDQARAFAGLHDLLYMEVSAKSGFNVDLCFAMAAKCVRQRKLELASAQKSSINTLTQQAAVPLTPAVTASPTSPPSNPRSEASTAAAAESASEHVRPSRKLSSRPSLRKSRDPSWARDEDVTHCTQCNHKFSAVVRKHHCRLCGQIFCVNCCSNKSSDRQRQCDSCFSKH